MPPRDAWVVQHEPRAASRPTSGVSPSRSTRDRGPRGRYRVN
jgi:hypothetical protein